MSADSLDAASAFVAAINAADLPALRALMTDNHTFTDSLGHRFSGAAEMIAAWQQFLYAFPDYRIRVDDAFAERERVALFGEASGRWRVGEHILPGAWHVAAAWLAEIHAGKVSSWSVFCDTSWIHPPLPAEDDHEADI